MRRALSLQPTMLADPSLQTLSQAVEDLKRSAVTLASFIEANVMHEYTAVFRIA